MPTKRQTTIPSVPPKEPPAPIVSSWPGQDIPDESPAPPAAKVPAKVALVAAIVPIEDKKTKLAPAKPAPKVAAKPKPIHYKEIAKLRFHDDNGTLFALDFGSISGQYELRVVSPDRVHPGPARTWVEE